jgi:hypothetical protein
MYNIMGRAGGNKIILLFQHSESRKRFARSYRLLWWVTLMCDRTRWLFASTLVLLSLSTTSHLCITLANPILSCTANSASPAGSIGHPYDADSDTWLSSARWELRGAVSQWRALMRRVSRHLNHMPVMSVIWWNIIFTFPSALWSSLDPHNVCRTCPTHPSNL